MIFSFLIFYCIKCLFLTFKTCNEFYYYKNKYYVLMFMCLIQHIVSKPDTQTSQDGLRKLEFWSDINWLASYMDQWNRLQYYQISLENLPDVKVHDAYGGMMPSLDSCNSNIDSQCWDQIWGDYSIDQKYLSWYNLTNEVGNGLRI